MNNNNKIVQKLLSAVLKKDSIGSLANLRLALNESEFRNDANARKLVAYAHMTSFSRDAREVDYAIDKFSELGCETELENILRICQVYKVVKPIRRIMEVGRQKNNLSLQFPNFSSWYKTVVSWFDLYQDSHLGVYFITDEDSQMILEAAKDDDSLFERAINDPTITDVRKKLLLLLQRGESPIVSIVDKRETVESEFINYCNLHDIAVIQRLQEGNLGENPCSYVYLVLDHDGIFKVYKEMLDYNGRVIYDKESLLYQKLSREEFLPRCYNDLESEVLIGGHRFLKLSVHYGQSLADYTSADNLLSQEEVNFVTSEIAEKLHSLITKNVLYLDLKPENILLERRSVKLLDLGIARTLNSREDIVDIFLANPRYAAPEGCINYKASEASLVYQLGILYCQLSTGKHPFCVEPRLDDKNPESALLKYSWPSAVCLPNLEGVSHSIISQMLLKDPTQRPSLFDVKKALSPKQSVSIKHKLRKRRTKEKNTVLWIGRMGIPHKGHIEYIARFLEMGFYVKIAISKAYTITQNDPLPKWIVGKMVAKSLFTRGFTTDDFEICLTPFYENDEGMKMHFLMMPERENVIGVASSNPDVWGLFLDKPIFDQRSVFGVEDQEYLDLSWGETLRNSVRENDYITFQSYVAEGVEKILSFDEIQECYGKPEIKFVSGKTIVVLEHLGREIVRGSVLKYGTPEESLLFHLHRKGLDAEIVDLFEPKTTMVLGNKRGELCYSKTRLDGKDEIIVFLFKERN